MKEVKRFRDIHWHALNGALVTIAILMMLVLASGCTSLEKAVKVATKTEANAIHTQKAITSKYKAVTAAECHEVFPVAESEVIQGRETTEETTTQDKPVVVPCKDAAGHPVQQVECPGAVTVWRTVTRVDTIRIRSTAYEYVLQSTIDKGKAELLTEKKAHLKTMVSRDKYKRQRNTMLAIGGLVIAAVIGLGVLRFGLLR